MKKLLSISLTIALLLLVGCTPKDPAIVKVFVRSSTNQLVYGAKVIIIGDQQSNPPTLVSGPDNTTGYFDILVKSNTKEASGYTRCRIHTTSVETIYLPN